MHRPLAISLYKPQVCDGWHKQPRVYTGMPQMGLPSCFKLDFHNVEGPGLYGNKQHSLAILSGVPVL